LFAELEEAAEKKRIQRSRGEMKHAINSAYYGFQCEDDDDPILLRKEQEREVIFLPLVPLLTVHFCRAS
jgi:hypothetical protein